ncbi:hemagglutinin/amebocyte aggregation factor-like isoform X3 [Polyodon spathula]|uniref:hemagglutinin/amebocyte aggregation factor-like isoform X3 n=1 Tax=Polyodon spathula TaxID=7913 RepID=UPI001B7E0224|nr:hemagglutinin/amebocyte aggregation factor-like isoform X3 [Polyodon spathula]
MKKILFLVFAVLQVHGKDLRWVNNYDQPFNFLCPTSQSIKTISSVHNNKHEDRLWDFTCGATFDGYPSCSLSSYVNGFDAAFDYTCPGDSVMSGMSSYHENRHEDRRWQFYCCGMAGFRKEHCSWSNYVNSFDEAFTFNVPLYHYLAGVSSYHENKHEDRRWRYLLCTKKA